MQYIGTFFICVGMFSILANKFRIGKSFLPSTLHSIAGAIALVVLTVQIYIGIEKMNSMTKVRRWHGNCGLFLWDLLVLTMLLGLFQFLNVSIFNLITGTLLLLVWALVHMQFRPDSPSTGMTDSEKGRDVGGSGLLIADIA